MSDEEDEIPVSPYRVAESVLYELWFSIAEDLFERVCVATQLDAEQRDALRQLVLRPNDFQVIIRDDGGS